MEGEVEGDGVAGRKRVGKGDLGYGVVLRVAIVGRDKVHRGGEIASLVPSGASASMCEMVMLPSFSVG